MTLSENSPNVQKFVSISEQVSDPVQVEVKIGNELFLVTQQDFRKIEDTRYLSFTKVTPFGFVQNNVPLGNGMGNTEIMDAINNAIRLGNLFEQQKQFVINNYGNYLQQPNKNNVASIQTQMDWEKITTPTCSPHRIHFSRSHDSFQCPRPVISYQNKGINTNCIGIDQN